MTHLMNLNDKPFELIQSGKKTIELRLNDEKRRKIRVGDHILFNSSLEVEVVALHSYSDFEELYAAFPLSVLGYCKEEEATASPDDMLAYYTKEQIATYGALGIEIKLI